MWGFLRSPHGLPAATPRHIPPPVHRVPTSPGAPSTRCLVWACFPAVLSGGVAGRPSPLPVTSSLHVASPQGVSLQDLLSKLGRPFREYELWALSHACLSTLRTHRQHPGDTFFCSSLFSPRGRQCPHCEPGPPWGHLLWTQHQGGVGAAGGRGLKGGHMQVTLLTPLIGGDIIPKEVKVGWGDLMRSTLLRGPPKFIPTKRCDRSTAPLVLARHG